MSTRRAVVLARGLGTRMRAADAGAQLTADQQRAADGGLKPMMPVNGRPFMDYVLSALADAGARDVALVVAPDHEALRQHYVAQAPPSRLAVHFIVQQEARGTADAVLATESWTARDSFLAVNADNLYPAGALTDLANLDGPGLAAFEREELVRSGNIPRERVNAFALIETDDDGYLTHIVEKPVEVLPPEGGSHEGVSEMHHVLISMNCWRFDSRIFGACRDVPKSARGELELPEAVGLAVRRGVRFKVLRAGGAVLDLSRRADAAEVGRRLTGVVARP